MTDGILAVATAEASHAQRLLEEHIAGAGWDETCVTCLSLHGHAERTGRQAELLAPAPAAEAALW
jgi:hypothetical protein